MFPSNYLGVSKNQRPGGPKEDVGTRKTAEFLLFAGHPQKPVTSWVPGFCHAVSDSMHSLGRMTVLVAYALCLRACHMWHHALMYCKLTHTPGSRCQLRSPWAAVWLMTLAGPWDSRICSSHPLSYGSTFATSTGTSSNPLPSKWCMGGLARPWYALWSLGLIRPEW